MCNGKAKEILNILIKISKREVWIQNKISGAIEADPIGRLMVNGTLCIPAGAGFDYLTTWQKRLQYFQIFVPFI